MTTVTSARTPKMKKPIIIYRGTALYSENQEMSLSEKCAAMVMKDEEMRGAIKK